MSCTKNSLNSKMWADIFILSKKVIASTSFACIGIEVNLCYIWNLCLMSTNNRKQERVKDSTFSQSGLVQRIMTYFCHSREMRHFKSFLFVVFTFRQIHNLFSSQFLLPVALEILWSRQSKATTLVLALRVTPELLIQICDRPTMGCLALLK